MTRLQLNVLKLLEPAKSELNAQLLLLMKQELKSLILNKCGNLQMEQLEIT